MNTVQHLRVVGHPLPFSEGELEVLLGASTMRRFAPGETLCRQARPATSCFILLSGVVEVAKETDGHERVLTELSEGAIAGQLALVDGSLRSATLRAKTDVAALEFTRDVFMRLVGASSPLAYRFQMELAVAARRVRWQRALHAAASLSVLALAASVALVLLTRLHVLRVQHPFALSLSPLALPLLGALLNALRPVRPLDAARRLDAHHQLHDRLGIAWQFRQQPPGERTPFMQAAIDDAASHARAVDVRAALPWQLPPELRVVAVLAALLLLVARVPVPSRTPTRPARLAPAVVTRDAAELSDDDLAAFREAARQVEAQARTDGARRGVEEFNRLLDDLAHRRLDRDEAFRRFLHGGSRYVVSHYAPDPADAVRAVRAAGGVPVLAHPFGSTPYAGSDAMVEELAAAGLFGLETAHRDHDDAARRRGRALAVTLGLLETGASDYHGTGKQNRLGEHLTDPDTLAAIDAAATDARTTS